MTNLADPAHPPSRKAPMVWAIGAAIPWLVLAIGQLVWFAFDGRLWWLHGLAAAVTVVGIGYSSSWFRCGDTACTAGRSARRRCTPERVG